LGQHSIGEGRGKQKRGLMILTKMFESEEEGEGEGGGVFPSAMLVKILVFLWHFLASLFGITVVLCCGEKG